jgi:16S rRNA U516 pseudouridylate synthase RsuA-like enzyme
MRVGADVEAGTEVEGKHVKPLSVELLLDNNSSNASRCRVKVVVNEGRHHEVSRMHHTTSSSETTLHFLMGGRCGSVIRCVS